MAVDYRSLAAAAKRLIGENGARVRLITPAGEAQYDPVTNDYVQNNETIEGAAIISNYNERLVNNTTIKAGDRRVIAVLAAAPEPAFSKLEVYNRAGVVTGIFQIINVIPVRPDGETNIVYQLQCRE